FYLWIDFSWIIFIFSIGMIAKTIWFNYGSVISLAGATLLLMITIVIIIFGDISWLFEFIFTNYLLFVTVLFVLSLVLLIFSYLLMLNAPLEKGNRLISNIS
ncbi:hypothetical protein D7X33_45695, partial [Butyricicoccus sp. 1XD8-22]